MMPPRARPLFSEHLPLTALWAALFATSAVILMLAGWSLMFWVAAPLALLVGIALTLRRLRTRVRPPVQAGGPATHAQSPATPFTRSHG